MGRYAERAENTARLLIVTRERYHEYRYRQDMEDSECVPVLLAALGQITGTDTGASGDSHEMIAIAPTTLWSLTADRHRAGSLAQSVERLGLAARAVRDQMSNDTWMVLAAVERAVLHRGRITARIPDRGRGVPGIGAPRDPRRDAGAVRRRRRVDGAGRRLDDDGHRQADRARSRADRVAERDADHGAQPGRRTNRHRVDVGGVRVVGHLPQAQPGQRSASPRWPIWCCSTRRTRARWFTSSSGSAPISRRCPVRRARRGRSGWSTRSAPGCAGSTRATSRTSPPTAGAPNWPSCSDGAACRTARPVRGHHRDASVAARRHAAAVGARRTPGDAMSTRGERE